MDLINRSFIISLLASSTAAYRMEKFNPPGKRFQPAFINPSRITSMRNPGLNYITLPIMTPKSPEELNDQFAGPFFFSDPTPNNRRTLLYQHRVQSDQEPQLGRNNTESDEDIRLIGWRSNAPKNLHLPYGLTDIQTALRRLVKNSLYHSVGLKDAIMTLLGKQTPFISFTVDNEPPSIFVNYEINPEAMDSFRSKIGLQTHVELMKVKVTDTDVPKFLLTLNAYHVGGIAEGLRFEWSTYIDRGDGKPSYYMVQTETSTPSMDPERIFSQPAKHASYDLNNSTWQISLETNTGNYQLSYQSEASSEESARMTPDRDWLGANDYVFWKNLICDRVFMDSTVYAEPLRSITVNITPPEVPLEILQFVSSEPVSTYALNKPANFVVQPWVNLDVAHHYKGSTDNPVQHFLEEIMKLFQR